MDNKKELEPQRIPQGKSEVEQQKSPEQNLETLSWMEKVEKKFARIPNDTSDINDDTVVIQPQTPTDQPPVVLPVTQQQMQLGKTAKTDTGIAWLVTWVIRQMKKLSRAGRTVRYQEIPEIKK